MEIKCTDTKTFELIDGLDKPGKITYESMFSFKATVTIANNNYDIDPIGAFSTTMSVIKNGEEVASMQMNWKAHIIIAFKNGQEFVLKTTGMFQSKYVLEDKDQQKIILLYPDFNWSKFNYNYNISYDNKPQDILLVLLATYGANYYMVMMYPGMIGLTA